MFNSQKINNDPEPYVVDFGIALGEVRSAEDCGSHWDSHDTRYEPRPEYDNNLNPLLEVIREQIGEASLHSWVAWLDDFEPDVWPECSQEHIDHARKVLERLVNVYVTKEEA